MAGNFLDKYQDLRKEAAKVFVERIIPGKPGQQFKFTGMADKMLTIHSVYDGGMIRDPEIQNKCRDADPLRLYLK